jgi:hypothetical protein
MSTTLKGAPIIGLPSGTLPKITATLRYTRDYAGGVLGGLGAGSHEIEYVWPAEAPICLLATGGMWSASRLCWWLLRRLLVVASSLRA